MKADPMPTSSIKTSPLKMLGMVAIGATFTLGCAALAFGWLDDGRSGPGSANQLIGYGGMAFFGAMLLLLLWRLVTQPGPVVTLSPTGLTDTRIAPQEIPWSAIQDVRTWSYGGSAIMVLAVDPAVEATLDLTRLARWSRLPNKALGADGLCVSTTDLATSFEALLQETKQRLAAARAYR